MPSNGHAAVEGTARQFSFPSNQILTQPRVQSESTSTTFEVIDSKELARRWAVPASWIREQTRSRSVDVIPHVRLGRYVRFEWGSPALLKWWDKKRSGKGAR